MSCSGLIPRNTLRSVAVPKSRQRPDTGRRRPGIRVELGGQYEESFADVEKRLLDFFTFKAVRVILRDHKQALEDELRQQQDHDHEQAVQDGEQQKEQQQQGMHRHKPSTPGSARAGPLLPPHRQRQQEWDDEEEGPRAPYSQTGASQEAEWLQNFVVENKVRDSKLFIRSLVQERQELAERIMVTRLHLYSKWAKRYDPSTMHAAIKEQNLELLRERLMETVKFQAEDSEGQGSTAS